VLGKNEMFKIKIRPICNAYESCVQRLEYFVLGPKLPSCQSFDRESSSSAPEQTAQTLHCSVALINMWRNIWTLFSTLTSIFF
jgi:hypothetical protein